MLKSRLRITSCFLWVTLSLLGFYPSSPAHADSFRTEGASDFYFELEAGTTFTPTNQPSANTALKANCGFITEQIK